VFTLLDDGIAYVVQDGQVLNDPGGSGSLASVDDRYHQSVVDAALACPGECIFIEVAHTSAVAVGAGIIDVDAGEVAPLAAGAGDADIVDAEIVDAEIVDA